MISYSLISIPNANRIDRLMDLPLLILSKTFYDGHHAYLSDNNRVLMDVLFWIRYSQTTSPMSGALHHQIQSLSLMMKRIKLLGFKLATMKYAHKLSTMYESQPLRLAITSKETLEWRKRVSCLSYLPLMWSSKVRVESSITKKGRYLQVANNCTMAPYGTEFSQGVCISIFIFYVLTLYLQNFSGFHCIVPMYVAIILLRNSGCRSNRKKVAEMTSQWFWCK